MNTDKPVESQHCYNGVVVQPSPFGTFNPYTLGKITDEFTHVNTHTHTNPNTCSRLRTLCFISNSPQGLLLLLYSLATFMHSGKKPIAVLLGLITDQNLIWLHQMLACLSSPHTQLFTSANLAKTLTPQRTSVIWWSYGQMALKLQKRLVP